MYRCKKNPTLKPPASHLVMAGILLETYSKQQVLDTWGLLQAGCFIAPPWGFHPLNLQPNHHHHDAPGLQTQSRWCHHGLHLLRPVFFFFSKKKKWCMKKSVEHHFREATKKAVKDIQIYKALFFKMCLFLNIREVPLLHLVCLDSTFSLPKSETRFSFQKVWRKWRHGGWGMFLSSYVG